MGRVLVFVPAYNCEKQIKRVVSGILRCSFIDLIDHVLVLDNRSSDATAAAAASVVAEAPEALQEKFTVGRNLDNAGLGGSHKVAFSYARREGFSHVVVLHGDDQGDISDIEWLLKTDEYARYDACLGARFHRESRLLGYSRFRVFGNRVFNALYSACARRSVLDLGSGLNVFRVDSLDSGDVESFSNDLTFNCYLLLWLVAKKRNVMFFPISWREDDQVSNVRLFRQAWRTLLIPLRFIFLGERTLVVKNIPAVRKKFEVICQGVGSGHEH